VWWDIYEKLTVICSNLDNVEVSIFCEFCLKMRIPAVLVKEFSESVHQMMNWF